MSNDLFEKAPVSRAYFSMALPVVFSMVITLVYNMVDTYFIAATGNTDLVAGVSLGAPLFTLMIALGDIWGIGGSSVISRLFGQKNENEARSMSVFCFYAAIACGIVVTALMIILRGAVLGMLGADSHTVKHAAEYYTGIAIGAPVIILSMTPSNLLRAEGLAKESMMGTVSGAVINMILDPIFISTLGLGAAGAAYASVIGYLFSDIYFIWILKTKSGKLSTKLSECHVKGRDILPVLTIGIPASITNLMQSFGLALMNRMLLPFGNEKVAAMGIVMKVNLIAVLVLVGFAFGGQPLIGYNYGAGNRKRFKEILAFCYKFEVALGLGLAVVLSVLAKPMISLFMDNPEIVRLGAGMLRFQQIGMGFVAVVLVTTCTFQSTGKAMGAFLLSVCRQGVIFAAVIVIASRFAGYTGVIASQSAADFLTAILAVILLKKYALLED